MTSIPYGGVARLCATVATLLLLGMAVAGCPADDASSESGDSDARPDWGEVDAKDAERTRTYLAGDGARLLEYADFAASLGERLDDSAYANRCSGLRKDRPLGRRALLGRLQALPDPVLGRLWTSQFPAAERVLQECADGKRDRSGERAEAVAGVQELVDRRLDELGVER